MAEITWKSILTKLVGGDHLSAEESEWFVDDLMNGNADPAAVGAVLATQQQLGLTPDEVRGAAKAMVAHAIPLHIDGETTDIVGTGGDGASTVNLSSMGAVVAAAAGVKVVKHGNRAASSKCGTADCFEALGLPMDLTPEQVSEVGNECGIAFAFARTFHPAMRFVGPIRAALGVPCVFNVLGPLTNPASPKHMAVGCANRKMSPIMAAVYAANGQIGMVYTSHEGLDEMAPTGPVSIWEFKDGKVTEKQIRSDRRTRPRQSHHRRSEGWRTDAQRAAGTRLLRRQGCVVPYHRAAERRFRNRRRRSFGAGRRKLG